MPLGGDRLMDALRERVKLVDNIDTLQHRVRRITSRQNWVARAASEADIDIDDDNADMLV
jgi:hypothetical protein